MRTVLAQHGRCDALAGRQSERGARQLRHACPRRHYLHVLSPHGAQQQGQRTARRCTAERLRRRAQALLNPHATGFAKTFTGSFMVGSPDTLIGPSRNRKSGRCIRRWASTGPRCHDHDSEVCGTCHTVHCGSAGHQHLAPSTSSDLSEWAFSAYRTGATRTDRGRSAPVPRRAAVRVVTCNRATRMDRRR